MFNETQKLDITFEKEFNIDNSKESAEVVKFVNQVLQDAYNKGATDIHLEPTKEDVLLRYRIDGVLHNISIPKSIQNVYLAVVSRIKIMAELDIAEKRLPQDGRIKIRTKGEETELRISVIPTINGESIVIRILANQQKEMELEKLGMSPRILREFEELIKKPNGIILVTGPTGSGKTTTLASMIDQINRERSCHILTLEDPLEYLHKHKKSMVNQREIGSDSASLASALRGALREDPDVIMVGEIRDREVGEIAVEAALTGHLVLSTLHTNDAPSTITRLINMGIEPFLVVAALNVVVAQRLCRRICKDCKEIDTSTTKEQLIACGISPTSAEKVVVYRGKGCNTCNGTGYKGRVAIYEVLEVTTGIKEILLRHGSSDEIKKQAIKDGMKTLRMCALTKVAQGLTTLDEAVSNSASDKM